MQMFVNIITTEKVEIGQNQRERSCAVCVIDFQRHIFMQCPPFGLSYGIGTSFGAAGVLNEKQ